MSAAPPGPRSCSSGARGPPAAGRAPVKEQIRGIVEGLELVLGDLKDVAKELREVVHQIDALTSDLQLEDEMTDSSQTDTLNSSSSGTTGSSLERMKAQVQAPPLLAPLAHPSAILTVLRKPNPPPPPPRLTPVRREPPARQAPALHPAKTHGHLAQNGGSPGMPRRTPNGDARCLSGSHADRMPAQPRTHRPEEDRCPQAGPRERVRFSENVQYHGYCPECESRHPRGSGAAHVHGEPGPLQTPGPLPPAPYPPPPPPPLENGGAGASHSHRFPPPRPPAVPLSTAPKPHKTILRKSTTTTV
ncbi:protein Largen-like [Perognathus longimembris pacificus]|uniref:protein Largen-like n=1 Tax=Perognathus longimembris pacificus TaxID=214514 RepID=UPI002019B9CC|nr:protein Largen-like [Perognathus longimembris pacificus]